MELVQIASAGAGFTLDAAPRNTVDLVQIAAAASKSGARVTFQGLGNRCTLDLVQIGTAGKGFVSVVD